MDGLDRGEVITRPFRHTIIEDFLDQSLYEELYRTFPKITIPSRNNIQTSLAAKYILKDTKIAGVWKELVSYFTSMEWYWKVVKKFNLDIAHYGGIRGIDHRGAVLECQCLINSPVVEKSSVKKAHVDSMRTKWAGLLYFKDPEDNFGGDLLLYDVKYPEFISKGRFCTNPGEPFNKVEYKANHFIGYENNRHSIHGVSERNPTSILRKYVNFTIDM